MSRPLAETVACPDCDLLQRIPELAPGAKARCARCGHVLASQSADPLDRPLALTLAAAIVFIVANTTSLMGLSAVGRFARSLRRLVPSSRRTPDAIRSRAGHCCH